MIYLSATGKIQLAISRDSEKNKGHFRHPKLSKKVSFGEVEKSLLDSELVGAGAGVGAVLIYV